MEISKFHKEQLFFWFRLQKVKKIAKKFEGISYFFKLWDSKNHEKIFSMLSKEVFVAPEYSDHMLTATICPPAEHMMHVKGY